jgi:hypothetical protein
LYRLSGIRIHNISGDRYWIISTEINTPQEILQELESGFITLKMKRVIILIYF